MWSEVYTPADVTLALQELRAEVRRCEAAAITEVHENVRNHAQLQRAVVDVVDRRLTAFEQHAHARGERLMDKVEAIAAPIAWLAEGLAHASQQGNPFAAPPARAQSAGNHEHQREAAAAAAANPDSGGQGAPPAPQHEVTDITGAWSEYENTVKPAIIAAGETPPVISERDERGFVPLLLNTREMIMQGMSAVAAAQRKVERAAGTVVLEVGRDAGLIPYTV